MVCLIVRHRATASDLQHTVRSQNPCSVLTAEAGGNDCWPSGSCYIGDAILFGIGLSIGAFCY